MWMKVHKLISFGPSMRQISAGPWPIDGTDGPPMQRTDWASFKEGNENSPFS